LQPIVKVEIALLKQFIWHYVIENPVLATQQEGQTRIISSLFNAYNEAAKSPDRWILFPRSVQDRLELSTTPTRVVADFIAGLTEIQAIKLHHRILGIEPGTISESVLD
jgi:dGTPase